MGQKENLSGGGGGGSAVGRRRLQTSAEASPRRRHASSIWPTSSSSSSFALVLFVLSVVAACFFFSSTSASASFLPLGAATGESRTQQQLPEWPLEAVGSFSSELLNGDSSRLSAPVDVDELATWFPPALVDEARRTVVSLSPVGRGLDIDTPAGPAAGSGGILLDSSALLVGARGKALNGALAALVPAGTRFVLTSRRAVSSGFASYEIALSDGRKVAARLVYVDAFYPVAVMVVVAEREGEEEAATATAKVAAAAGAGSPLVPAAAASQKVDPASLPAATLYPPPEDDARVVGLGGGTATEAEEQESRPPLSAPPSAASSAETVVVEPNDPLLFLGHSPDSRLASTTTTTTTFVGYVSDLRAAFPRTRTPGRGVRGIIARALVARRSPGPGGGAFDVSGRLFGLDVDRDVRGVVAASDKKAEVYVLPAIYLRDALARAVSASLKESLLLRSEGDAAASSSLSSLSFRRPRADGGFAATLVPLGVAVDRYKLNTHIAEMLRSDPRLSGWPNAGGTVPKVIKVAGVDAGSEGEGGEHDGVRAGDLVVGVVVEESSASAASGNSSVTRLLGDDLHALDDAFARAVAAARAAEGGGGALASAGDDGWGAELAAAATSSSSSFLARPSPASPPEASLPPSPSPPAAALVKLVVSRHGELRTVSAAAVELDAAPAKPERVLLWARCRFVDPPASARRLYQFAGPGVALAACDPESPLSAVVNADPREEDEAPTTTGAPPPSKTPVVVTAIGGAPTPNLAALVRLLSSRASPAGKNTTVAYRSIHTGRDSYAYVEGVSFDAGKDASSERQPFREFVFSGRARSWVLLAPLADGEEEGKRARARSSSSSSSSASLLPVDAEDLKARAAPAKGGKGKGQAAGASASASSFVSRGKTSAAAAALPLSPEDPSDNDEENQMARGPLAKPSSLSDASDWLSLAAKALGKAPVHASQSTWGSPEALLRIKQQAVQVSINDALPLEHTDATPSAVGTGFVVEATLGIIATVRGKRSAFCFLFGGGWGSFFEVPFSSSFSRPLFSPTSNQKRTTRMRTSAARRSEVGRSCSSTVRFLVCGKLLLFSLLCWVSSEQRKKKLTLSLPLSLLPSIFKNIFFSFFKQQNRLHHPGQAALVLPLPGHRLPRRRPRGDPLPQLDRDDRQLDDDQRRRQARARRPRRDGAPADRGLAGPLRVHAAAGGLPGVRLQSQRRGREVEDAQLPEGADADPVGRGEQRRGRAQQARRDRRDPLRWREQLAVRLAVWRESVPVELL